MQDETRPTGQEGVASVGTSVARGRDLPLETLEGLPARADVVIVGGGIAGASVLHHLAAAGVDTLLLERDRVGGGATAAAVGVLSPPLRQPYHETAARRGAETAASIWRLALRSMSALAETLTEGGAAAEAELDMAGGHVLAEPFTVHEVERSFEALEAAGFPATWLDAAEVRRLTDGRGFVGGFRLAGSGALNPAATARLLARGAVAAGARVAEGAGVSEVVRRDGGLVCRVGEAEVRCDMVVYAVHTEARRFSSLLGDEVVPIRGQAMSAEIVRGKVPPGAWSTHWKLNVWRRSPAGRLHLGGWRHEAWDRSYWKTRPAVDPSVQEGLLAWFRQAFPDVELRVTSQWSGIFGWTADYLPMVGPLPGTSDELVISGFSGGGLPFAFECGRMLADIVRGRDPGPEAVLLAPRRFVT
jgi:glycine/D-amino acid oxidase-like deaminating enzyme